MIRSIYMAGGFYGDWRQRIRVALSADLFPDVIWLSPETNNQQACLTFVSGDLKGIDGCDLVVAYLHERHYLRGTAAEIGYAFARGKPVYLILDSKVPDMFLVGLAKRVFIGIGTFTAWCHERQDKGLPGL